MATDEERREVAERLREIIKRGDGCISSAVFRDGRSDHTSMAVVYRLAYLIDPDTTTDTTINRLEDRLISPIASPTVDRDALIGLSEEMEMHAQGACDMGDGRVNAGYLWAYADRIRDALGVADADE